MTSQLSRPLAAIFGIALAITAVPTGSGLLQSSRGVAKAPTGLTPEQEEILGHLSIVQLPDGKGGTVKTLRVEGINLQIVNGLGATNGDPTGSFDGVGAITNGLGNLIVGYNELDPDEANERTGSHNIVVGVENDFTAFGGLVGARGNRIDGAFTSVFGGSANTASGLSSSVFGGYFNSANGAFSAVVGGQDNTAGGDFSSVAGGRSNSADGVHTSVTGGASNTATAPTSSVTGGAFNSANGVSSSVSGGFAGSIGEDFGWLAGDLIQNG